MIQFPLLNYHCCHFSAWQFRVKGDEILITQSFGNENMELKQEATYLNKD